MYVAMDTHADGSASIFFTRSILPYLGKLRNRENFSTQKFRLYPINMYNKTFKMENFCALPTTSYCCSNYEAGNCSVVKHSRLAKIHESFPSNV